MSLVEETLFGRVDKVAIAIERLKTFEPPDGYYGATSFGKDSLVIMGLCRKGNINVQWHHNITTLDPPELVYFGRKNYPEVIRHLPKMSMWKLMLHRHRPPSRVSRFCCDVLKEQGGKYRRVVTGIRWQESHKRSQRKTFEQCYKDESKFYVNPIIDWTTEEVFEFLSKEGIEYPSLYDEGFKRLGCIGCPMGSNQRKEFERWPKYYQAYIRTFERLVDWRNRNNRNNETQHWDTAEHMMEWYCGEATTGNPDQTVMFE